MTELNTPILPPSAAQPSRWKIPDAFLPKSIVCLREGYGRQFFFSDVGAGLTVAIIALPLSLALAIGSGVRPEQGLFTAIVAGFLVSALGGSRVQIGGPAVRSWPSSPASSLDRDMKDFASPPSWPASCSSSWA